MSYLMLIVEKPGDRVARSREEGERLYESMVEFGRQLQSERVLVATQALRREASRVHAQDGRAVVVDGPFTEAKEVIGGFFLLSCETRAEALAIAQRCPAVQWATIEVREAGPCYD
jgi:hypothetical protein